ncbi:helix-turn-helix domain-containing protein [Streptomyces sp. NPDC093252]|uniref:AraC-like ligand-binding domain-containing protein n=1 Tax=Streptomyces sp. NPDC093252 TaxID=3154980 RepID=UPI003441B4FD
MPWSDTHALALCESGEELVSRDARHTRTDPRGTCELLVPLTGSARVEQGGTGTALGPGSMVLCPVDRPLAFAHAAGFRSVSLIVPGDSVTRRSPAAAREPRPLSGDRGLGRPVRQRVATLRGERAAFSGTTFGLARDRLLDLVCQAAEGGTDAAPAVRRTLVEASIRRHVRAHADEDGLGVASLARALGRSTRSAQQVLHAADTTPRDLIRRERLRPARSRRANPAWGGHSISRIAHSRGFGSHASFATAFRQECGTTPMQARHGTCTGAPTGPRPTG